MTEAEWQSCTYRYRMLSFLRGKASDRKLRLFACACCRPLWHLLARSTVRKAVEIAELYADGYVAANEVTSSFATACGEAIQTSQEARKAWNRPQAAAAASVAAAGTAWIHEKGLDCWEQSWSAALVPRPNSVTERWWGTPWDDAATAFVCMAEDEVRFFASSGDVKTEGDRLEQESQLHEALWNAGLEAEKLVECYQVALLRDLFGNPFRPATLAREWLAWKGGAVPQLARAIYDEKRFKEMPILGDALEDAGCLDQDILAHCRQTSAPWSRTGPLRQHAFFFEEMPLFRDHTDQPADSGADLGWQCHGPGEHVRGCWVLDLLLSKE